MQTQLLSREWWVSVFVVGLVIHLLASYLKPQLDRMGGWVSKSWATRNKRLSDDRRVRIAVYLHNETERSAAAFRELRLRILSLWLLAQVIVLALGLLGIYFSLIHGGKPITHPRIWKSGAQVVLLGMIWLIFKAADTNSDAMRMADELAEVRQALMAQQIEEWKAKRIAKPPEAE
jgi:hypothetical protein